MPCHSSTGSRAAAGLCMATWVRPVGSHHFPLDGATSLSSSHTGPEVEITAAHSGPRTPPSLGDSHKGTRKE
jgi:hypothetical protein